MPDAEYQIIVAGLGAMGSAALYHLARRGVGVLGLDRYEPPHALGSSHGRSRIIREAYYEHPLYVPLVQRASRLWEELERESGATLLLRTGGLMIGPPASGLVAGARRSADTHRLRYEMLDSAELGRRFPAFRPAPGDIGLLEPGAGVLDPERCVGTHLARARVHGASLRFDEPVLGWQGTADGVIVTTTLGRYRAGRLILAAGPWMRRELTRMELPLVVERQCTIWFQPLANEGDFHPRRFPVFIWEWSPGRHVYGFPDLGDGVKVAVHHEGAETSPEAVAREVTEEDERKVRSLIRRLLPDADGKRLDGAVCLYTDTPDANFIIDRHPGDGRVVLASPCSGHGFKFSSAVGEILADLATDIPPALDLTPFALGRFTA